MSLNRFFFLACCLFLLPALELKAQTVFSGTATDAQGKGIPGASIMLLAPADSTVLSFAITDTEGAYSLSFSSSLEEFLLSARSMSYRPYYQLVKNQSQQHDLQLVEDHTLLNEVEVKAPPVSLKGDTLSYNLASFAGEQDRTLAEALAKLPGVEVQPDGRILYQGKPIEKFYIEGLDLLEGKYNLATNHMPHKSVGSVEVLENHQPVKMMEGRTASQETSMNITLKKDITLTGSAQAGGGLPGRWKVEATPMLFTKKHQLLTSLQTNNTGYDVSREIKQLTIEEWTTPETLLLPPPQWGGFYPSYPPFLKKEETFFNTSHLLSGNYLRKMKKGLLRINLSYVDQQQYEEQQASTRYLLPEEEVALEEEKATDFGTNLLEGTFTYERNEKKRYLKNSLILQMQKNSQLSDLLQQQQSLQQQANYEEVSIANRLKDIVPFGQRLLSYTSFISYSQSPQNLWISENTFLNGLEGLPEEASLDQSVRETKFSTYHAVEMTQKAGKWSLTPSLGLEQEARTFSSALLAEHEFRNALQSTHYTPFLKTKVEYKHKGTNLQFNMPLKYVMIQLQDTLHLQQSDKKALAWNPSLRISYRFNKAWKIRVSAGRNLSLSPGLVHYGYVLKNYRSLDRREIPILQKEQLQHSMRLTYRNVLHSWFGYLAYNRRLQKENFTLQRTIDAKGNTFTTALNEVNPYTSQQISGNLSKWIESIQSSITLNAELQDHQYTTYLNEQASKVYGQQAKTFLSIENKTFSWMTLEGSYNWQQGSTQVEGQQKVKSLLQTSTLNVHTFPAKRWYAGVENTLYKHKALSETILLTNLKVRYTFGKRGLELEGACNNLWNNQGLTLQNADGFQYTERSYQIRPMQVMLAIKVSL